MLKKLSLTSLLVVSLLLIPKIFYSASQSLPIQIYNFEGNVALVHKGKFLKLKPDLICVKGDVLRTDSDSSLDLIMKAYVGMKFFSKSEIEITNDRASDVYLKLNRGEIIVNATPLPRGNSFKVETPLATAVIDPPQATQYWGKIEEEPGKDSVVRFAVRKGYIRVLVTSSGTDVTLLEGQSLFVDKNTYIPSTRNCSDEENKILSKTTSVIFGTSED